MANASEAVVQRKLVAELNNSFPAIYVRKIHQSQFSHNGIPDLVGCLRGEWFAIEVKTDKGKPTKLQERELRFIKEAGGIALVCYGMKDIPRMIEELNDET